MPGPVAHAFEHTRRTASRWRQPELPVSARAQIDLPCSPSRGCATGPSRSVGTAGQSRTLQHTATAARAFFASPSPRARCMRSLAGVLGFIRPASAVARRLQAAAHIPRKLFAMSSSPDDAAKSVQKLSPLDGDAPESTDFANYFCTYAYLYHQKDMLEDHKRTSAYFRACVNNKKCFEGRVVLDVGTGSGILAIFAAKAGAKKVYAVEATDMARFARMLVDQNGFSDVIEVIQGTIETVQIPEKVDIIISEWMGYFLLRESMLDSVLVARDRFLKPDGALYPSHARLFVAPIWTHNGQNHRLRDYDNAMAGWGEFVEDMHSEYGVDMKVLSASFQKEQRDYFLCTAQWTDVHPDQLMGPPQVVKEFDLKAVTLDEIKAALDLRCALTFDVRGQVDALCGWFDVTFQGSAEHPAYQTVILNTGPDATGATHWGQQSFYFGKDVFLVNPGDKMDCSVTVERRKDNQRLLQISMAGKLSGSQVLERSFKWNIE